MIVTETRLAGVFIIEPRRFEDGRGFFAPSFSANEFASHGMASVFVESNISYSERRGTLRGVHYQSAPYGQDKLVRCTQGAIFDVVVDLRSESTTFKQWVSVELTAANHFMVYVPRDCGHGFQTLEDRTEVCYMVSQPYNPESCCGVRWNDPAFNIRWPDVDRRILIDRDRTYADFDL